MPEYALMPESYSLFPYTFCSFNPYLLLNFKFFNHSSLFAFYTYNTLSAGAQNVTAATGAYVIMLVYRRLLTTLQALVNNVLTWQSSCVIANNA